MPSGCERENIYETHAITYCKTRPVVVSRSASTTLHTYAPTRNGAFKKFLI